MIEQPEKMRLRGTFLVLTVGNIERIIECEKDCRLCGNETHKWNFKSGTNSQSMNACKFFKNLMWPNVPMDRFGEIGYNCIFFDRKHDRLVIHIWMEPIDDSISSFEVMTEWINVAKRIQNTQEIDR